MSAANVTIVCGAVLLSARLVGQRTAVALAAVGLVAFVIVVQPTASVLRAAVMGALALLAVLAPAGRRAPTHQREGADLRQPVRCGVGGHG